MLSGRNLTILLLLLAASLGHAQRSGVLLAVAGSSTNPGSDTQSFDTIHAPQYQTLWIAPDSSGEIKVLAVLPEIIVPRKDGFWHVGVQQICEFNDGDFPNESLEHIVWAVPVAKTPIVQPTSPCTPHKPEDYAGPYGRVKPAAN